MHGWRNCIALVWRCTASRIVTCILCAYASQVESVQQIALARCVSTDALHARFPVVQCTQQPKRDAMPLHAVCDHASSEHSPSAAGSRDSFRRSSPIIVAAILLADRPALLTALAHGSTNLRAVHVRSSAPISPPPTMAPKANLTLYTAGTPNGWCDCSFRSNPLIQPMDQGDVCRISNAQRGSWPVDACTSAHAAIDHPAALL